MRADGLNSLFGECDERERIARWSELLCGAIQTLQACARRTVDASRIADLRALLRARCDDCGECLTALFQWTSEVDALLPIGEGVFIADRERAAAYCVICGAMPALEIRVREMERASYSLHATADAMLDCEHALLDAAAELTALDQAVRLQKMSPEQRRVCAEARMRLSDAETDYARQLARWQDCCARVADFLSATIPQFCAQVSKNADFSSNGAACDPRGLRRLCADLRDLIGRLESFLKEYE